MPGFLRHIREKNSILPKFSIIEGIFLFILTFSTIDTYAQENDVRFTHLFERQSLNAITDIFEDRKGLIWIGTINGLYKYNGINLKKYLNDPKDSCSLSENTARKIIEDNNGNLWIATRDGLNLYNRDQDNFKHLVFRDPVNSAILDNSIDDILEDKEGNLWVANESLCLVNKEDFTYTTFRINPGRRDYYKFIYEDHDGNLWFVSLKDLYIFNKEKKQFDHIYDGKGLASDLSWFFTDMVQDNNGKYWVTTNKAGLISFSFDGNITKVKKYDRDQRSNINLSDFILPSLKLDSRGNLWIASENAGLFLFDRKAEKFRRFIKNNDDNTSISSNSIWTIYEDKTGRIWYGTFSNGICLLDPYSEKFRTNQYSDINKYIPSTNITSFLSDEYGNFWIGTDGGGLNYYNSRTNKIKNYRNIPGEPNSLNRDAVLDLCYDDNGNLWIGTWDGGINILSTNSGKIRHLNSSNSHLFNNNIFAIANDHKGHIYIGSFNNGLFVYDISTGNLDNYINLPGDEKSISDDYIFCLYFDKNDNLWIGTMYGGLNLLQFYDKGNRYFKHYKPDPLDSASLSNKTVQTIYEDDNGQLWIGTGDGLDLMDKDKGTFKVYREKDGLPDNTIQGILSDKHGNLWITTLDGLSKMDKLKGTFRNYNINDGLQGDQFNRNAVLKTNSGLLCFGGTNGLNIFCPDSIRDNPYPPNIILTDFKIFNKSVPVGKTSPLTKNIEQADHITLSYKQSVFIIEFAALNYTHPENNLYAYKLEGLENEWNFVGNQRNATYTNLDPRKYKFRVIAANNDGVWNKEGISLDIYVTPPFWETWWFRISVFLILVFLVYSYTFSRLRRSRRQSAILKKLVIKKTEQIVKQYADLERKNSELNRKRLENLEITEKLREADEKKLKFFANISHELRTPLTLIVGPAENLIKNLTLDKNTLEQLNLIHKNGNRLLRLMNELLDFQKIDSDSMRIRLFQGNLDEFINNVVNAFEGYARKHHIDLYYACNSKGFVTLFDPDKIEIILYNLISNALKYTDEGGEIKSKTYSTQ